ncbi:TonB-dependent receptor [Kineobactrum sediminis]|nr:TonB-dependent receptor [Kineobactrum sediminis]
MAQDDATLRLEEIVVTAQMREEGIMDVPLSMSAFDGSQLRERHITSVQDLAVTPGVSGFTGSSFVNSLSVRGVSTNDFGVGSDPSVAIYQNGIFMGRAGSALSRYFDMGRVEVLKGPQGTLFGRSATAGVLHAITAKPVLDQRNGYIMLGAGERGILNSEGAYNMPLSDRWAMRIAGFISEEDGWVDNRLTGEEHMGHEAAGARFSLRFVGEKLSADFALSYEERDQSANIYGLTFGSEPQTGSAWVVDQDAAANFGGERDETEQLMLSLQMEYDLGSTMLTSITGYRDYDFDYVEDVDASPYNLYDYLQKDTGDYWSQELRLLSKTAGAFDWGLGISAYTEDLDSSISVGAKEDNLCGLFLAGDPEVTCEASFPQLFGIPWPGYAPDGLYVEPGTIDARYQGYSVFGDLTYHLTDRLDLTAGLRYSYDQREFDLHSPGAASNLGTLFLLYTFVSPEPLEDKQDWDDLSPRVVLEYRPNEDSMLYASVSKGYKAGGFDSFGADLPANVAPFTEVPPGTSPASFESEEILSWEIGYKASLWDNRVRTSVSAYLFDYDDLQLLTQTDTGNFIVRNAGSVESTGIEFEAEARINAYVSAYLGVAWSDSEADDVGLGTCQLPSGDSCDGNRLPNNPEWNGFASVSLNYPAGRFGDLFLTGELNYNDTMYSNLENNLSVDAQEIVNLRAGIETDGWRLALYVENLTDEDYFHELANGFLFPGDVGYAPSRPRTIGAELYIGFGN